MDARALHPAPDGAAGQPAPLGDYLLSPHFARQATADVYDATHTPTGGARRVYVLRPGAMQNNPVVHRVVCEADAARWLRHPVAAKLEAYGDTPSRRLYVAVERPAGRPLGELLAASGALAPWRVVRLAGRLVEALDEAHAVGLVHGRLTPAVVIVAQDADEAVGTARGSAPAVTLTGLGTAAVDGGEAVAAPDRPYVSPEQLAGREPDVRSDVFGLASLLQYALTGTAPAGTAPGGTAPAGTTPAGTQPDECDQTGLASPPHAAAVDGVLAAARAGDPQRRPATVKAFWEDLLEALVADAVRATQGAAATVVALPAAPLDESAALAHLELAEFALAPAATLVSPAPAAEPVPPPALTFGGLDLSPARWQPPTSPPSTPRRTMQPRWAEPRTTYSAPARSPRAAERPNARPRGRAARAWWLAVPALVAAFGWPVARATSAAGSSPSDAVPAATAAWRRITAPPVLDTVTARPRIAARAAARTAHAVAGTAAGALAHRDADASGVADEATGPEAPRVELPVVELPGASEVAAGASAARALVRPEEFTTRIKVSSAP